MNHLIYARRLSKLLDTQFNILGFKFGLDPVIGLIPGVGDFIPAMVSIYLLFIAVDSKLPANKMLIMIFNIILDFVLGLLPIIGDISDFVFKSNERNFKILEEHLMDHYQ